MNGFISDCRHGLRLYARTPGASSTAIVVLAVGMAFVGAFLSLFVDLSLKSFPGIEDSERLVTIAEVDGDRASWLQFGIVERFRQELTSLDALVAIGEFQNIAAGGDGGTVNLEYASRDYFDGIRPKLLLGRGFAPAEHDANAAPVAVVSERYWRERYEGRSDVLGETIELHPRRLDGEESGPTEFRIVGVMAPEMRGVVRRDVDVQVDLWVPLEQIFPLVYGPDADYQPLYVATLGRLRAGVSAEALIREIATRFPGEAAATPSSRFDAVNDVVPDIGVHRDAERQLGLFLIGSILLALVAAANISLFLLARAPSRRRELSVRFSIGAPIGRLVRQLATEAALLIVVSTILGLLLSVWLANLLRGMPFLRAADWGNVTLLDWRVLSLLVGFLFILTLLVSIAPVLGLRGRGVAASNRHVSASATFAQRIAGTAQVALAGTFAGAGIAFVWFLSPLLFGDPGYEVQNRHVVTLVSPSFVDPSLGLPREVVAAHQRETIEALPGVEAVTFGSVIPSGQSGGLPKRSVLDPSDPTREIMIGHSFIDSRFVDVLGLRLLYGRTPSENEDGISLVNEALARRLFGRENVVGESLVLTGNAGSVSTIVGVLEDLSFTHPAATVEPAIFAQGLREQFIFRTVIQSSLPPNVLVQQLQELYDSGRMELAPNLFTPPLPLSEFRDRDIAPDRARGLLTISTACLVVLIAALGFYGTQRYLVGAGQREYAIRASLGAGPGSLGRLVFRRGLALGTPGVVLGALLAFVVVAWLRDDFLSPAISPSAVTLAVVVGLAVLMLAASIGPARVARGTLPAPLLRED
jgi:putative ABC transport system permease protein